MVKQYPHILKFTPLASGDTPIVDGEYQPEAPGDPIEQKCRYEPSSNARQVETYDGTIVTYKGIVYLPKQATSVPPGVEIEVANVVKGKALYFYRGQLNCTLYI